jgi:type IV secretion system protein TrbB
VEAHRISALPPFSCPFTPLHYYAFITVAPTPLLVLLLIPDPGPFNCGLTQRGEDMVDFHRQSEAILRGARMLRSALGTAIAGFLEDPQVVEVMLNPDGRLWIDRLSEGLVDTGERLSPADGERIVRLVAHHVGVEVHARSPRVSAELPETGERFEGLVPPVVAAPTFAIRKPAVAVFTLQDYVAANIMSTEQAMILIQAVTDRRNILVAGGTSTGKTTLTNALLAEVSKSSDRIVLIEDTRELQCAAPNLVAMRTKDGVASLSDLVRSSLRLRPDRIPIGEVRGAEALDLLKAWGTGHPGGIGTIHAGTAIGALRRLEQLIQEAVVTVPRALIAETIDLIAVLSGRGSARRLTELAQIEGLNTNGDYHVIAATQLSAGDRP